MQRKYFQWNKTILAGAIPAVSIINSTLLTRTKQKNIGILQKIGLTLWDSFESCRDSEIWSRFRMRNQEGPPAALPQIPKNPNPTDKTQNSISPNWSLQQRTVDVVELISRGQTGDFIEFYWMVCEREVLVWQESKVGEPQRRQGSNSGYFWVSPSLEYLPSWLLGELREGGAGEHGSICNVEDLTWATQPAVQHNRATLHLTPKSGPNLSL